MINVRAGLFETNSSSMHSVAIIDRNGRFSVDDIMKEWCIQNNGRIMEIYDNDSITYGNCGMEFLIDFGEKLKYCIASLCSIGDKDEKTARFRRIVDTLKEILPNFQTIKLPMADREGDWYKVDKNGEKLDNGKVDYWNVEHEDIPGEGRHYYTIERNGDKVPVEFFGEDCLEYGYVDHQSWGLIENFLKEEGITLKDFFLDKKYAVVLDSDELQELQSLTDLGLINKSFIKKQFPMYPDGKRQCSMDSWIYYKQNPKEWGAD